MESALRCAVERRELHLVYQPRVAIDTFELTGIECLARWDNPQFGKIRAEEFIPIAEETGIIDEIGRWTIEDACRQVAAWRDRYYREKLAVFPSAASLAHALEVAYDAFARRRLRLGGRCEAGACTPVPGASGPGRRRT